MTHIEYDPNRSARIALIVYADGEKRYIIAPDGLKAGMTVTSGPTAEPKVGNCLPLSKIPTGMAIHNLEMQPGGGGQALPLGRRQRHPDRPRGDLGPDHPPLGRGPPHPGRLPGHDRHGRQRRPHEHPPGQGRPQPLAGPPARTSAAWP